MSNHQTAAVSRHIPVLLNEICSAISGVHSSAEALLFLDCTLGGGGHAECLLELFPNSMLVGIDQDHDALLRTGAKLERFAMPQSGQKRLYYFHQNYSDVNRDFLKSIAGLEMFEGRLDAIILDLGISSDQLDSTERGFSFRFNSKLDMRMNSQSPLTAHTVLNDYQPKQLLQMFRRGGLSKKLKPFVDAIIHSRPLETSWDFLKICERVFPGDSAALPFQAVRIEVNAELEVLEKFLEVLPSLVRPGAIFVAISFHSLEDQFVTRKMREWGREVGSKSERLLGATTPALGRLLTKSAILPSEEEINRNPRSRSARLRVFHFER
jgi:16S rRNA (cytosine1402-N4)-methyltransferase